MALWPYIAVGGYLWWKSKQKSGTAAGVTDPNADLPGADGQTGGAQPLKQEEFTSGMSVEDQFVTMVKNWAAQVGLDPVSMNITREGILGAMAGREQLIARAVADNGVFNDVLVMIGLKV